MIRTNIVIDDKLMEKALEVTGLKTRRERVDHAIRELIRRDHQKRILELKGQIKWEGNLAKLRKSRSVR